MEKDGRLPEMVENVNDDLDVRSEADSDRDVNEYVSVGKDIFSFINKASWKAIFKVFMVAILVVFCYFGVRILNTVTDEENIARMIAKHMEQNSNENEEVELTLRETVVTPKIQRELEKLCYTINADRAFIFELHNGKRNPSGLPFRYADMSYEEPNEEKGVERVAMEFQNIPLTLYKYPHYLAENKYIYGDLSEIAQIDNGFAGHIEKAGGKYLGMLYMTNNGLPLGFLCVSFHDDPKITEDEVKAKLEQYGKIIAPLLDMDAQIKNI